MRYTYKIPGKNAPSTIFRSLANKTSVAAIIIPETFSQITKYKIATGILKRRRHTEAVKFSGRTNEQNALYVTPFNKLIVFLIHRRRKISDEHVTALV